jgi:hypothetical protein
MNGRLMFALTFACIVGVACSQGSDDGDDPKGRSAKDAVETNVLRHSCEDAGPCDAGTVPAGEPDEVVPCDDDSDCPDGMRCDAHDECAPRISR